MTEIERALWVLNEIEISVKGDIKSAIDNYIKYNFENDNRIGFFAIPRLIFPEIECLGSLYAGKVDGTSRNSVNFIKEYFSKVNQDYLSRGAFIYYIYRHGLTHQHFPKTIKYKGGLVGWEVSLSSDGVLTKETHLKKIGKNVQIDGRQFYEDFIGSLNYYKEDIKNNKKDLVTKLLKTFNNMWNPTDTADILVDPKKRWITREDFDFLN